MPHVDQTDRGHDVGEFPVFELDAGCLEHVVGHAVGTEPRGSLGEGEGSTFTVGEERCLVPRDEPEQSSGALAGSHRVG